MHCKKLQYDIVALSPLSQLYKNNSILMPNDLVKSCLRMPRNKSYSLY